MVKWGVSDEWTVVQLQNLQMLHRICASAQMLYAIIRDQFAVRQTLLIFIKISLMKKLYFKK